MKGTPVCDSGGRCARTRPAGTSITSAEPTTSQHASPGHIRSKLRDELWNREILYSLAEAMVVIES
jgi:hypothetical protein